MSQITSWLLGVLSIVLITVIVDMLLPDSKMSKYIKSVLATITVLVIVMPLPSIIKNGCNFNADSLFNYDYTLDENFLDYANSSKLSYLARGVEDALEEKGFLNVSVEIKGYVETDEIIVEFVTLNIKNLVLESDNEHINKYNVLKQLVTEYLYIEEGQVIINEN